MEPVNRHEKRRRGRRKNRALTRTAPPDRQMFPAVDRPEKNDVCEIKQGLSALHVACLCDQLSAIKPLVESKPELINSSDSQGRRPVHMLLSSKNSARASSCLRYLLEHGADIHIATDSGTTPLHQAASEGLLDCAEILVQAGADVLAQDSAGHTPLDLALIWCRRKVARYLKSCMWQEDKRIEMQERHQGQVLYSDLVDMVKLNKLNKKTLIDVNMAEWAKKKGLPPLKDFTPRVLASQFHTECLPSVQKSPSRTKHQQEGLKEDTTEKQPPASPSRPWTIFMGLQPEKPPEVPDLQHSVAVWRDCHSRRLQYTTKWDQTPRPAPDLPLDVLQRVLFPRAFPSRIVSPQNFEPQDIEEVQHRGYPQGRSTSPWTEVAMHLAEVLEPGHY